MCCWLSELSGTTGPITPGLVRVERQPADLPELWRFGFPHNCHGPTRGVLAAAYGWPATISDDDVLMRLLALNRERAAAGQASVPEQPCVDGPDPASEAVTA
jgi:hypothetical protein